MKSQRANIFPKQQHRNYFTCWRSPPGKGGLGMSVTSGEEGRRLQQKPCIGGWEPHVRDTLGRCANWTHEDPEFFPQPSSLLNPHFLRKVLTGLRRMCHYHPHLSLFNRPDWQALVTTDICSRSLKCRFMVIAPNNKTELPQVNIKLNFHALLLINNFFLILSFK